MIVPSDKSPHEGEEAVIDQETEELFSELKAAEENHGIDPIEALDWLAEIRSL